MQAILDFIHRYAMEFFIVFVALALLRLLVCAIELKHTAILRNKKGKYHSVKGQYSEMGGWIFSLPGLAFGIAFSPELWYAGLVLAGVLFYLGYRLGHKKGTEMDDMYRDIAWELKQEEAAQAARETAARTLESGSEPLPEHEGEITDEMTEDEDITDEGESNNG